ncbi:MAG: peptide ABC transporter substrate-binding protein [Chloroflexi bacterium]|nr:peptide ABC transporter substrate-binding protein [Chloroflexota bacterium]
MLRVRVLLVLIAASVLIGCRAAPAVIARELRLNLGSEPPTLDPVLATDPGSQQIIRMIFSSLVELDPTTGAPQHGLSNGWAVSADGLIWEFKLREDAVWVRYVPARGIVEKKRAVTARDVVYSVRRVFDPRVGSGFAMTFAPLIRGAEQLRAANPQTTSDAEFERLFGALGVSAIDDSTVRFILTRPASYFPSLLATWLARIQPRESIEAGGTVWTEPGTLWTSGPYYIERWSHNREIILRKNDNYYDAGSVAVTRISFAMIADTATALDEYKNGDLDSLDPYGALTATDVNQLREDPLLGKQLQIVPSMCAHYYGFNVAKEPFKDVLVRKAFVAAIDRETLTSSIVYLGEPARWFTRPGIYASPDISDTLGAQSGFNVNQAREYLRQSGYDRRKLGTITLAVNTSETHVVLAETIAQMWKSNLNVEVRVARLDWKSYLQNLRDDTPQIFRLGYCAYYPDAANFANVFRSNSPDNFTRWVSLPFDQQVINAARETDATKRRAMYRAAEKMLIEDQAIIEPLWWSQRATLTKPNIRRTYAITDGYERFDLWNVE